MMYKLYYSAGTCSRAVHAILNELNVPFELEAVNIRNKEGQSPEFKAINPRGNVPVLTDGGHAIREGGAIISYLLDKHQSPLLPREGFARATALEWLMFANATLHPAFARLFYLKGMGETSGKVWDAFVAGTQKYWDDVEARLNQNKYLAGETVTAGDILLTVIAGWAGGFPLNLGPKTKALVEEISARPAFKKAVDTEQSASRKAA